MQQKDDSMVSEPKSLDSASIESRGVRTGILYELPSSDGVTWKT